MRWAAGLPDAALPHWTAILAYAETYGVEPHLVDPPLVWWLRISALRQAQQQRAARERVEQHGLEHADPDTRRLYDALVLGLRN